MRNEELFVTPDDLRNFEAAKQGIDAVIASMNTLNGALETLKTSISSGSQSIKDLMGIETQLNANKEKANALTQEANRLATQQERLNAQLNPQFKTQNDQIALLSAQKARDVRETRAMAQAATMAAGSFGQMKAELSKMKVELDKLTLGTPEFVKLANDINTMNTKIRDAEASFGSFGRNVGNYGFNPLSFQVQQLARELPSLAVSPQQFFLAISNNLPMLVDQVRISNAKIREEIATTGKATTSTIKQILASIVSWQTALVVGITLLTRYSKEITGFVASLFKGEQQALSMAEALEQVNEKLDFASLGKTITNFEMLRREWIGLTDDMNTRQQWIENNRTELDALGVSVQDVTDAENLFVHNSDTFIQMVRLRAIELATAGLAAEKYAEYLKSIDEAERKQASGPSFWGKLLGTGQAILTGDPTDVVAPWLNSIENLTEKAALANQDWETYLKMSADAAMEQAKILQQAGLITTEEFNRQEKAIKDSTKTIKGAKQEAGITSDLDDSFTQEAVHMARIAAERRQRQLQQQETAELDALRQRYEKGRILSEQFEDDRLAITRRYAQLREDTEIDAMYESLKALKGDPTITAQERRAIETAEQELANKIVDINRERIDEMISDEERLEQRRRKAMDDYVDAFQTAFQSIADINRSATDSQIANLDREMELFEKDIEKRQDAADRLAEHGAITEEEANLRKAASAQELAEKEEQIEARKRILEARQARWENAVALTNAIAQGVVASVRAFADLPFFAAIPVSITVGATVAALIAQLASNKIPAYAKGTDNHSGGLAIVGDGGKSELVIANGRYYMTPNVPTLVDMPAGAIVMPDYIEAVKDGILSNMINGSGSGDISIVSDMTDEKIVSRIERTNQITASLLREIRKQGRENRKADFFNRRMN